MNLIDKIPAEDMELMTQYVKTYAFERYNADYDEDSLRHVLRVWDQAKQHHLYKLFGGQFILRKEINVERSDEEARVELEEYLDDYRKPIPYFMEQLRKLRWDDSFEKDNPNTYDDAYYYLTSYDTLPEKVWTWDSFTIYNSAKDKSIVIQEGMKLTKAYRKIANLYGIDGFEQFNLEYSRYLNQDKLAGNLVLSIHPMDYMTMSDNECDWQSCMNWPDEGEYRQGTVEMMNSECVIVAYLESSKDFYPVSSDRTWSNKKWRQLFIVNEFVITGIKPYPYFNCHITNAVLEWLHELAVTNCGYQYYSEPGIYSSGKCEIKDDFNEYHCYKIAFGTDMMYCDFGSRCGDNYMYVSPTIPPQNYYLNYSGVSECMCCGSVGNIPRESKLTCYECCGSIFCSCCHEEIEDDEGTTLYNGEVWCIECLSEYANRDYIDDEWYPQEMTNTIYLVIKPKDSNKCEFVCNHPIFLTDNHLAHYDTALKHTDLKDVHLFKDSLFDHWADCYYFFIDEEENEELVEILKDELDFNFNADSWFSENDEIDYDDIFFTRVNPEVTLTF